MSFKMAGTIQHENLTLEVCENVGFFSLFLCLLHDGFVPSSTRASF
jgi:hypothetical protein